MTMNEDEPDKVPPSEEVALSIAFATFARMYKEFRSAGVSRRDAAAIIAAIIKEADSGES